LDSIHAAGLRHGNITLDNLLVDDAGNTTIVDFSYAEATSKVQRLAAEKAQLRQLLDRN
jgi:tRNA A-37 threonylcarbamoyl transferase component Bud32